jgi:hypothetical protein
MWTVLNRGIDPGTIAAIVREAGPVAEVKEQRHFVAAGKKFFYSDAASPHRLALLKAIHLDLAREIPFDDLFAEPVVDHAYLLFKSGGAPATAIHQDRPYWVEKESLPSMFTAWASLSEIDAENGALTFNVQNKVPPEEIRRFNTGGTLYPHIDHNYSGEHSALSVAPDAARALGADMTVVPAKAGQVIVFDGFEPHGSTDNRTGSSRLALKVVYGEGQHLARYLLKVRDLVAV